MTEEQFRTAALYHAEMMVKMAEDVRDTVKSDKTPISHLPDLVDISGKLMVSHLNAVEKIAGILPTYYL